MTTEEIIQWKKYNLDYLAMERVIAELKLARPNEEISEWCVPNIYSKEYDFNIAQFANFLGELLENFRDMCEEYECSKIKSI